MEKLKYFANGIFYSKLSYCLAVFGNVFGLQQYKDGQTKYVNYTTRDNNKLQVLQNRLNRILTRSKLRTPTEDLLNMTHSLSVQQMIAQQTLVMIYKILQISKPAYLANKIKYDTNQHNLRTKGRSLKRANCKLNQSKEGFVNRAILLFNKLDEDVRNCESLDQFKQRAKIWVKKNVQIKPIRNQEAKT